MRPIAHTTNLAVGGALYFLSAARKVGELQRPIINSSLHGHRGVNAHGIGSVGSTHSTMSQQRGRNAHGTGSGQPNPSHRLAFVRTAEPHLEAHDGCSRRRWLREAAETATTALVVATRAAVDRCGLAHDRPPQRPTEKKAARIRRGERDAPHGHVPDVSSIASFFRLFDDGDTEQAMRLASLAEPLGPAARGPGSHRVEAFTPSLDTPALRWLDTWRFPGLLALRAAASIRKCLASRYPRKLGMQPATYQALVDVPVLPAIEMDLLLASTVAQVTGQDIPGLRSPYWLAPSFLQEQVTAVEIPKEQEIVQVFRGGHSSVPLAIEFPDRALHHLQTLRWREEAAGDFFI